MDFFNPESDKDKPLVFGNMWGWKFSFISLGIIVVLLSIAIYRFSNLNQSPPIPSDQRVVKTDSIDQNISDTIK